MATTHGGTGPVSRLFSSAVEENLPAVILRPSLRLCVVYLSVRQLFQPIVMAPLIVGNDSYRLLVFLRDAFLIPGYD